MSIYKKLQDARIKLQNTKLEKTGHNKFAGYYYFELGDFLPAINQIFSDIGLCGVASFSPDIATLTIVDVDDNSQIVITSPMATADMKGLLEIQKLGAVETYQRRYLWVTAMEIVEHDAIDAGVQEVKQAPQPQGLSVSAIEDVINAMTDCTDVESLKEVFGAAYKKADKQQKATIKSKYDALKENFTGANQ